MTNHIGNGISNSMRGAGAPRSAGGGGPSSSSLTTGLLIGVVMDDKDEQRAGRIWVKIPQWTSRVVGDPNEEPRWKGTTPDRRSGQLEYDSQLRRNWILCQPLFGYFGSDQRRSDNVIDGRNSYMGDVSSYGSFSQPRIGDHVAVMFMNGDPNVAFYTGMLSKPNQGRMVPGSPGYGKKLIVDGVDEKDLPADHVAIAGYDNPFGAMAVDSTGKVTESVDRTGKLPAHTQARTAIVGGLGFDIHRGPGTSSMKRESPSYIYGVKTPGWNYDSEQFNSNMDRSQFKDNANRYKLVNTTGHQFVMDDHPDHQLIRLRSSGGAQILICDSGDHPYIYVGTAKGNSWIEISDSGKISMFSTDSVSFHTKADFNITADRDINMECGNDFNLLARNDMRVTVAKETHWAFVGDHKAVYQANSDNTYMGNLVETITRKHHTKIGLDSVSEVGSEWSVHSQSGTTLHSDGAVYLEAGALLSLEAPSIWLNSGVKGTQPEADTAQKPKFFELKKKDGPPVREDIIKDKRPEKKKYLSPIVPQHQPWSGCEGSAGSQSTTTGRVSSKPNTAAIAQAKKTATGDSDYGAGLSAPGALASQMRRAGAVLASATRADDGLGSNLNEWTKTDFSFANSLLYQVSGVIQPQTWSQVAKPPESAAIWRGQDYVSSNNEEHPSLVAERWLKPGDIAPVDSFKVSQEGIDFMKANERLAQFPIPIDATTIMIGYGHSIKIGETIDGVVITKEIYQGLLAGGSGASMISLDEGEADALFKQDLKKYEDYVRSRIKVFVTQSQFDALTSYAFHDQAIANPLGSTTNVFSAINNGRNDIAQELMAQNVYVDGLLNDEVVRRRQAERTLFNTIPNDGMEYTTQVWYPPNQNTVRIGEFVVNQAVKSAIDASAAQYGVDARFMYAMAAQESGFNPNAKNTVGGQTGLFQFPPITASLYGISGNEADPYVNANATGRYIQDAKATFRSINNYEPGTSDLYIQMFMGQEAGAKFVQQVNQNPNNTSAMTANQFTAGLVDASRNIFYRYDGTERTNRQVYDFMKGFIDRRLSLVSG